MAVFFYKQGIRTLKDAYGEAGNDWTTVQMDRAEYEALQKKIKNAEQRVSLAESDKYDQIRKVRDEADRKVAQAQKDASNTVEAVKKNLYGTIDKQADLLETYQDMAETAKNKNNNLIRIMRERANAKRGLTPKKTNPGYMVLSSEQYDYRYKPEDARNVATVRIWRTVLQSPYDATIPIKQARDDIEQELHDEVLGQMRFRWMEQKEYAVIKYTDENGVEREGNNLFKWTYKANYKSGFWEVVLYHTKSIIVPEGLRPSA